MVVVDLLDWFFRGWFFISVYVLIFGVFFLGDFVLFEEG